MTKNSKKKQKVIQDQSSSGLENYENNIALISDRTLRCHNVACYDKNNAKEVNLEEYECVKCGSNDDTVYDIVLCDNCNDAYHTCCTGLDDTPEDDWYCKKCSELIKKLISN